MAQTTVNLPHGAEMRTLAGLVIVNKVTLRA